MYCPLTDKECRDDCAWMFAYDDGSLVCSIPMDIVLRGKHGIHVRNILKEDDPQQRISVISSVSVDSLDIMPSTRHKLHSLGIEDMRSLLSNPLVLRSSFEREELVGIKKAIEQDASIEERLPAWMNDL